MPRQRASTWVKICGTTSLRDAQLSTAAGANALGFVFAASPRRINLSSAAEMVAALAGEVDTIGVFVNEEPSLLAEIVRRAGLSGVQLHGDETPGQAAELRAALPQKKIIKTLSARQLLNSGEELLAGWFAASQSVDAILLDSGSSQLRGGSGVPFDWEEVAPIAATIREKMPLIIAGGLHSGNVARAIELFQPWGVDVVSGVEREPGQKDETKLRDFMTAVRAQTALL
jgi:phosphoribosylanthranilate isomerase